MLIGIRVQTAEEYDMRIEPYQGRSWPGAVLKFLINDLPSSPVTRRFITNRDPSGLSSAASSRPTSFADYPSTQETPMTTPGPEFATLFPSVKEQSQESSRQAFLARIRARMSARTDHSLPVNDCESM
jgi:next to BRCA1 gene 1 protein